MNKDPIGIFDSGVGGLTIAKEIIEHLPGENIIYLGDNAHNPYGEKDLSKVQCYVKVIAEDLIEQRKCKALIIACNTAAIAGMAVIKKRYNLDIIGPVQAGVQEALAASKTKKIAVVATSATIKSNAYQEAITALDATANLYSVAAKDFVPLVEAGKFETKESLKAAESYLSQLRNTEVDTLILGCTHYPFLAKVIQEVLGSGVKLIFPGLSIAKQLKASLAEKQLLNPQAKGQQTYLTTSSEKLAENFLSAGRSFLNLNLDFTEHNPFTKKQTVVLGVIGADVHAVGNRILDYALTEAGFKVVNIGVMASQKEFIEAAIETGAKAILVSSLYGHGEIDCRGFKDRCVEKGLDDIQLYVGGNLVIGKQKWPEVRQKFKEMGFDRIYPPGTAPEQAISDLRQDLNCGD